MISAKKTLKKILNNNARFEGKLTFGKMLAKKVHNCMFLGRDHNYLILYRGF